MNTHRDTMPVHSEERTGFMTWRDKLLVHPACDRFRLMNEEEFKAFVEDIKVNGMIELPVRWTDERGRTYLLDGRNRMNAAEILGIEVKFQDYFLDDIDPEDYVISANVHRRHLSREEKRAIIIESIKKDPDASNREIGRRTHSSDHTVAKARAQLAHPKKPNEINDDKPVGAKHHLELPQNYYDLSLTKIKLAPSGGFLENLNRINKMESIPRDLLEALSSSPTWLDDQSARNIVEKACNSAMASIAKIKALIKPVSRKKFETYEGGKK